MINVDVMTHAATLMGSFLQVPQQSIKQLSSEALASGQSSSNYKTCTFSLVHCSKARLLEDQAASSPELHQSETLPLSIRRPESGGRPA